MLNSHSVIVLSILAGEHTPSASSKNLGHRTNELDSATKNESARMRVLFLQALAVYGARRAPVRSLPRAVAYSTSTFPALLPDLAM